MEVPIEDVVGKINQREPDVIQQFRRQLRLHGQSAQYGEGIFAKVAGVQTGEGRGLSAATVLRCDIAERSMTLLMGWTL
ncbi:MAG: hypothetical protein R3C53_17920 [Pirellulaceae bacterium]